MSDEVAWRRIPAGVNDEALLGGLDLAATLKTGKAVRRGGLLETIRGGVGLLAMAERAEPGLAGRLAAALDGPEAAGDRGARRGLRTRRGGPGCAGERLALHVNLNSVSLSDLREAEDGVDLEGAAMARSICPSCSMARWNARSLKPRWRWASTLCARRSRPCARRGLRRRWPIGRGQRRRCALAARLVLAPRARRIPMEEETQPEPEPDRLNPMRVRHTENEDGDPGRMRTMRPRPAI